MYKKALALLSAFVIITGCNGLSLTTYASELTCKSEGIYYLDDSGKIQTGWQTINEPLIKSFHDTLSDGFSSVGNDAYGFNQQFLNGNTYYFKK